MTAKQTEALGVTVNRVKLVSRLSIVYAVLALLLTSGFLLAQLSGLANPTMLVQQLTASDVGAFLWQIYGWGGLLLPGLWLYRLHQALGRLYASYPIKPWRSIDRYYIPLYNLWGILNIFRTMAAHFRQDGGLLASHADRLQAWTTWYVLVVAARTIQIGLLIYLSPARIESSPPLSIEGDGLVALSYLCWLPILRHVDAAVRLKANQGQLHAATL